MSGRNEDSSESPFGPLLWVFWGVVSGVSGRRCSNVSFLNWAAVQVAFFSGGAFAVFPRLAWAGGHSRAKSATRNGKMCAGRFDYVLVSVVGSVYSY
ncbi:uncharacterized protein BDZ83DRAFT_406196 [Colletotrichum acutatum]|uniref:Uncharacterized protein n=1 Tax=Glomerella acutata TaxID=27357 RepID=A0AAD8UJW3_GLOAC|nr:uncharacterized protein BDZ83DRAFT_406196 [Colletotrichum acutatum]KAK1723095.1 hypothetical protein BDZ83DRAFT_406196 [Colletotrichum acutatum]